MSNSGVHSQTGVDMRGKVAVVTGGNTGIGYATAKSLAILGAHVIIACRSEHRALAAIHQMKRETSGVGESRTSIQVEYLHLDLASLDSIRRFTTTLCDCNQSLDLLINNAGISWAHYGLTENGFEQHYQVNHLGHYLLTLELLPLLEATAQRTGDSRIIFVSSRRHVHGVFDPRNMNGELSYSRYCFYNNSKLYNVMAAYALQRRLKDCGITVSSLHPGLSDTEMSRNMADMVVASAFAKALKALSIGWRSAEKGAATSLYVATRPELNSQQCHYYSECRVRQSSPLSRNKEVQEKLWTLSMRDVWDHLSPETRERFGGSYEPKSLTLGPGPLQRTRTHSFRSTVRPKPEDKQRLIDNIRDSMRGEYWVDWDSGNGELIKGAEEDKEAVEYY